MGKLTVNLQKLFTKSGLLLSFYQAYWGFMRDPFLPVMQFLMNRCILSYIYLIIFKPVEMCVKT